MDDLSGPLGFALIAVGAFVVIKAVKAVVKLLMIVVVIAGIYLLFGVEGGGVLT